MAETTQSYLASCDLSEAFQIWQEGTEVAPATRDRQIVFDMISKLNAKQRKSLSFKQQRFLADLLVSIQKDDERKAEWAREAALAEPLPVESPDGERMVVSGEVVSLRNRMTFNGDSLKMVVRSDEGWKTWGTVPSAIRSKVAEGDIVRFTATVKPSDNDPKFGFFSRPTKATILYSAAENQ
jgi:hypothetical protein